MTERYLIHLQGEVQTGDLDPETLLYKRDCLNAIRKTWPEFSNTSISKLTRCVLENFRVAYRGIHSATRTNGSITVLRELLESAVEHGQLADSARVDLLKKLRYTEVDYDYKRMSLDLPDPAGVAALRACVHRRCNSNLTLGFWLFDFLLFSGSRNEAAGDVCWSEITWGKKDGENWVGGSLYFRNAKYGNYTIPLFPELRRMRTDLKSQSPGAKPTDRLLPTRSLQTVLTNACRELAVSGVKCPHVSHHDLRHFFATAAIEQGADWITLAAWLGHHDNGRTAMLIYGHLRRRHSDTLAAKMQFLPAENPVENQIAPKPGDFAI